MNNDNEDRKWRFRKQNSLCEERRIFCEGGGIIISLYVQILNPSTLKWGDAILEGKGQITMITTHWKRQHLKL
jgi:hypothetical protein